MVLLKLFDLVRVVNDHYSVTHAVHLNLKWNRYKSQ